VVRRRRLGVYIVHRRSMIVDLEITALLPFRDASTLGGVDTKLGLSFALW